MEVIKEEIDQIDTNMDGEIDLDEFKTMMENENDD